MKHEMEALLYCCRNPTDWSRPWETPLDRGIISDIGQHDREVVKAPDREHFSCPATPNMNGEPSAASRPKTLVIAVTL
jgi:hypothetical protein